MDFYNCTSVPAHLLNQACPASQRTFLRAAKDVVVRDLGCYCASPDQPQAGSTLPSNSYRCLYQDLHYVRDSSQFGTSDKHVSIRLNPFV